MPHSYPKFKVSMKFTIEKDKYLERIESGTNPICELVIKAKLIKNMHQEQPI